MKIAQKFQMEIPNVVSMKLKLKKYALKKVLCVSQRWKKWLKFGTR